MTSFFTQNNFWILYHGWEAPIVRCTFVMSSLTMFHLLMLCLPHSLPLVPSTHWAPPGRMSGFPPPADCYVRPPTVSWVGSFYLSLSFISRTTLAAVSKQSSSLTYNSNYLIYDTYYKFQPLKQECLPVPFNIILFLLNISEGYKYFQLKGGKKNQTTSHLYTLFQVVFSFFKIKIEE